MAEMTRGEGLELLAVGRALAAQSHELKNVFAIIGETTGLMDDLLAISASQGEEPSPLMQRLQKSIATVQAQVTRGHALATDLNILAHLPDHRAESAASPDPATPVAPVTVDLQQQAVLTVRLMARPASQAQVTMAVDPASSMGSSLAAADPAACQAALLSLERWLLTTRQPGDVLNITGEDGAGLTFSSATAFPALETVPEEVALLLERAGLTLEHHGERLRVAVEGETA